MARNPTDDLGKPDIEVDQLRIWVHGRQFPAATDYWDANWIDVTTYCVGEGSSVCAAGPFIHLREISGFLSQCEAMYEALAGTAELACMEPNLNVRLESGSGGRIAAAIDITPNQLAESHRFTSTIDQTYLPSIISACKNLLNRFPVLHTEG